MDFRVLFSGIVFLVFFGFHAINLYLPQKKRLKYVISLCFSIIGLVGWFYVWFGNGWLITSIISSAFLILSTFSFVIALGLDFVEKVKSKH